MNYSLDTLRWGLTQCHDRNVAAGKEPFASVKTEWWVRTSGHSEEDILAEMARIKADRLTRAAPNADAIDFGEGK